MASTKPRENPGGRVTEALAVELSKVPASGVESITWSPPFSETTYNLTRVPTGILWATMPTVTGCYVPL